MKAVSTHEIEKATPRKWVLYDGECPMCTGLTGQLEKLLRHKRFGFAPLQSVITSDGREVLWGAGNAGSWPELHADEPLTEMFVLAEGKLFGGADAVVYLARWIWWAYPLHAMAQVPGVQPILKVVYRWVAERRHCLSHACHKSRTRKSR